MGRTRRQGAMRWTTLHHTTFWSVGLCVVPPCVLQYHWPHWAQSGSTSSAPSMLTSRWDFSLRVQSADSQQTGREDEKLSASLEGGRVLFFVHNALLFRIKIVKKRVLDIKDFHPHTRNALGWQEACEVISVRNTNYTSDVQAFSIELKRKPQLNPPHEYVNQYNKNFIGNQEIWGNWDGGAKEGQNLKGGVPYFSEFFVLSSSVPGGYWYLYII